MEILKNSILEKEQVIFPDLDKRFNVAEDDLAKYRIDVEKFRGLYEDDAINQDVAKVSHIKEKFLKFRT